MARKKKASTDPASTSGVKRVKYVAADAADEDVFEQVPNLGRGKKAEAARDEECGAGVVIADQRRICPRVMVKALKGLNDLQRRAVQQMGFGSVLELRVGTVPPRMISWCLSKFDAVSCSIEVPNHAPLRIAPDDVYLVFGFPRGPRQVDEKKCSQETSIAQEWSTMFNKPIYNIKPSDVVSRMLAEADGGVWFKRLFLILVECCLFETAADGYVKPRIMDILCDISKIREHDWCDHMVACLLRGHQKWEDSYYKKFNGPSVFLALFYVDRVVHCKRPVPRVFPLVKGWTTKALRDIDNVGIGKGFVEKKLNLALPNQGSSQSNVHANASKDKHGRGVMQSECADPESAESYTLQLLRTAKSVADSMSTLMTLIIDAPLRIRQDVRFNNAVQTTSLLIGVKGPSQVDNDDSDGIKCTQRLVSEAPGSLEWQNSIITMAEVFDEKIRLEEHLGDPSFCLGVTQFLNEVVVGAGAPSVDEGLGEEGIQKVADDHASVPIEECIPEADLFEIDKSVTTDSYSLVKGIAAPGGNEVVVDVNAGVADIAVPVQHSASSEHSNSVVDAIDAIVKDLNVQHFEDMLQENTAVLAMTKPSFVGSGGNINDETVDDIVDVINAEPMILQTQSGIAVGGSQVIRVDQDSDDEPLINKLKRSAKEKFPTNKAAFDKHIKAVLAKGKDKMQGNTIDEETVVAPEAKRRSEKGKAVMVLSPKPRHGMSKRSKAEMKKGSSMLSPFNERAVCVSSRLTSSEKNIYRWLGSKTADSAIDEVFWNDDVNASRLDLMSLQPQKYVKPGVIDAWTSHLNSQERLRSQASPRRFFFTTFPCSSTFAVTPVSSDEQKVKELFWTRLEDEVELLQDFLKNIDMVFLPICHNLHIYVVVVDLKSRQIILLDNSTLQVAPSAIAAFGDIPTRVGQSFCEWLINKEFVTKGRAMQNARVKKLELPWCSTSDYDIMHSGVFAMRHMETYMGGRLRDWSVGFGADAQKVLQELRVKYSKTLLTSDVNHKRDEVSGRVQAWIKGFKNVK